MTDILVSISLLLNVVVLVPVTRRLFTNANWVEAAYGPLNPARAILLAVYCVILIASLALLFRPDSQMVSALLAVQLAHKLISAFTVGAVRNPVVAGNLAIAVAYALTCATLLSQVSR